MEAYVGKAVFKSTFLFLGKRFVKDTEKLLVQLICNIMKYLEFSDMPGSRWKKYNTTSSKDIKVSAEHCAEHARVARTVWEWTLPGDWENWTHIAQVEWALPQLHL
mgnify:CR=1 FL=1